MTLRTLTISLADRRVLNDVVPDAVEPALLGGRGLGAWMLGARVGAKIGPLSPDNQLIFAAGPLAGRLPSMSGGFTVTTRSPLTRGIAHGWALGGWGAALRRAGYDALALTGQSQEWCVVRINDGQIELLAAGKLLGLDTVDTARALRRALGDEYSVVCIGPAGEAGVSYASIVADGSYAAEPAGAGAVMAHKRIKAIAVRGTGELALADAARVHAVIAAVERRAASSDVAGDLRAYGGLAFAERAEELGALSARNGQESALRGIANLHRDEFVDRAPRDGRGCLGCPLPCHAAYTSEPGEASAYPDLDALAGFGPRLGITDPETVVAASDLCLRLGIDAVAMSAALGFLMECSDRELTRTAAVAWGDGASVLAAIRRMGQKHEKRDILSLGVGEMAEVYWGSAAFAPQVKRLAFGALDLRALPLLALATAVSPIGGDYRYAMAMEELLPAPPAWLPNDASAPPALRGVVARLIWYERFAAALDAAGLCRRLALYAYQITPGEVNELLSAALGRPFSGADVAALGERLVTFERALAHRYDLGEDTLPVRWRDEPLALGAAAGKLPALDDLIPDYYRRHGWDPDGRPTPARLVELGIDGLI